jgi:predicted RND superfamily exporter protein
MEHTMLEKFLNWTSKAYKKPWPIIVIAVIGTIIFALGIPGLKFDNNIKTMLPANNRDLRIHDYYEDENRFGASDVIYIGIDTADAYSQKSLEYVKLIKDKIEALNNILPGEDMAQLLGISVDEGNKVINDLRGVGINELNYSETMVPLITSSEKLVSTFGWDKALADKVAAAAAKIEPKTLYEYYENPVGKTQSLVNADFIASEDDSLVVKKLIDNEDVSPESVAGLKERVASWSLYEDGLVSKDGKFTVILVSLNSHNINVKGNLNRTIEKIMKDNESAGFKTYLDGEPVIEEQISRYMVQDISMLIPLVVIVVLLILFLCFRNVQGVIYPAAVILMSVVWSVGLMSFCHIPVTVVGTAMPVLLVAIISAYGIHQMNHYLLDPATDKLTILNNNMKNVGLAVTLSGITVMVGFGALLTEDFVPVKNFGIFTAWGDLVGIIGALYVLPALILVSKKPKTTFISEDSESQNGWVGSILKWFVNLNRNHPGKVLVVSLAVILVFFFGLFGIETELNNVSTFKKSDPVHVADDHLNQMLAGTEVLNVVLDSDLSDPLTRTDGATDELPPEITTPEVLNKIESFGTDVSAKFPNVRKVVSFNDVIKKMHQEMNGGGKEFYAVPQDSQLISQYLMIFTGDIKDVVSPNHDKLRITLHMKRGSSNQTEQVREYCVNYFGKDFLEKNHLQLQITGASHLYDVANTLLVDGTFRSVAVCLIVVFLLLLYVLGSFLMSLIAMVPIFATLIVNFGILGLFHIPLNAGTAMVSSVAIGIGVDYSIHFITWFRNEMRKKPDIDEALDNSITHKGRAILYNMFVIVGGFLVMVVSKFIPLIQFGSLVALCMVLTAIGALAVVPAIIRLLAKKDYNFLYLGTRPKVRR